ncbi:MAG: ROK family transcriptional regulator [Lachnospiraceae bacterium]|jgi:N-acetylglucosamine repressor|nr:ROK family transcriptional regulator [Lachnospiraceae bacterium]
MQKKAALPRDLKRKNRNEILRVFQKSEKQEWSLAEVSEYTGISRATVRKAVMDFVEQGIVLCTGKGSSTEIGGKRPEVFAFHKEYRFFAYLNIGIGWLSVAILDLKLKERGWVKAGLALDSDPEELVAVSKACYRQAVAESGVLEEKICGLCIGTSGMVDQETGTLRHILSYPRWGNELPIKQLFEDAFPGLIVMVENVARAAGRAELYFHRELEMKKVFTIFTYRGVSGCLMKQGRVFSSSNSLIGEIGHMILCPDDMEICRCGSRGCFENMVAEERILREMRAEPQKLASSVLGGRPEVSLGAILEAAEEGDAYSRELTDKVAWLFSLAIRNVILTIDPEVIVIQGKYSAGKGYFHKKMTEYLYNEAYFPNLSAWEFLYDERNVFELARIGMASAMAEELCAFGD